MDIATQQELLTVVQRLSPLDTRLVIQYARTLQETRLGDAGLAYLEFLTEDGASPAEIARAARAVQQVETRYTTTGPETFQYDLQQRTEEQMRIWLSERGLDYDTLTEAELDELGHEMIQQSRKAS